MVGDIIPVILPGVFQCPVMYNGCDGILLIGSRAHIGANRRVNINGGLFRKAIIFKNRFTAFPVFVRYKYGMLSQLGINLVHGPVKNNGCT